MTKKKKRCYCLCINLFISFQDLESDPKTISFSKNGEDLGVAFELTEDLEDKALHPHILIKNAEFSVNFGSQVTDSIDQMHFTEFLKPLMLVHLKTSKVDQVDVY